MAYPGDPSLDATVQQRVLTAFAEAVRLHREGHSEESRTILRSITDVDPRFSPAQRLEQAIAAGAPVDLAQLIGEVSAGSDMDVQGTLAKARQAFAQRDFQEAMSLAQSVLRELPGQVEARQLALDAQARVRATGEIHTHIARVREALDAGLAEEAKGFLKLAKDLDPTNPELAVLERRLSLAAKPLETEAEPEFEFEVFDHTPDAPPAAPRPTTAAPPTPPTVPLPPAAPPTVQMPRPVPPAAARPAAGPPPAPAPVPRTPHPTPPPVAPAPAAPQAPAGGFRFDQAGDAFTMEFQPGVDEQGAGASREGGEAPASAARIQSLLDQGQQEFDRTDFQAAIDTWSRIYLIDAQHAEAERRIGQARRRREEVERLAEQRFHEAKEAYNSKRLDEARALCKEVLKLQPQHLEAHDLMQRLETPAAPPPPPAAPPLAGEEDLFRDDFVPDASAGPGMAPSPGGAAVALPQKIAERFGRGSRVRLALPSIPLPWLGVGVGVLVVVLVAGFLLRHKVFKGESRAVAQALARSETLATGGKLKEAIQVLQSVQGQVEGEQANQVNQRILGYQRKLKAQAAPTPVPGAKSATDALAAGRRVKALQLVRAGLAKAPGDAQLLRVQAEITSYSSTIPALADQLGRANWDDARRLAEQILKEHPDDTEVRSIWVVATFNTAIVQLRKYQVAQAHVLLVELARTTADPEVTRLKEFAQSYLARPADPLYQTFVNSCDLRAPD
jgi:tetratricopeptide (TPR) repeat protein